MALDSIREILDEAHASGTSFWEVVLQADMEERQVTREASMAKMLTTWMAMQEAADAYTGTRKSVSGLVGGEWQYPQNMGHRVNTEGDDIMPVLYGDFLVYSTNGKPDQKGGYDFYAARLVASEQTGDTVMMYPIGRCSAFSLERPFCSIEDDFCMTFGDEPTVGWWVMHQRAVGTTEPSRDEFFCFKGRLDVVKLNGRVLDRDGNALPRATVSPVQGGKAQPSVVCDNDGRFALYMQTAIAGSLTVKADDYFETMVSVTPVRFNEERLYSTQTIDVELSSFDIDKPYVYGDLFNSSVTSELSAAGRVHVDSVALFLMQNPHLKVLITSDYDMSEDMPFCSLLNQSRLRSLTERLVMKGVSQQAITTSMTSLYGKRAHHETAIDESPAVISSKTVSLRIIR